ncbi:MAG: ammonium transporter [Brevinematales bacterium]|nr:ammonium transporter [Brevinematales bacterium]
MRNILRVLTVILVLGIAIYSFAQDQSESPKIDTGDTAWMIVATALVMLMTVPGLALFYGGMARRKDALNTIAMSFSAFAIASVVWTIYGYTLSFSGDTLGIIGTFSKVLLNGVSGSVLGTIPEYIFVVFQLTFAAITLALISGAFIERIKFSSWILFSVLWLTLVYVPIAHWVWGGGFLYSLGALDFAGGTVVHINAGIAALAGAIVLGRRKDPVLLPHNITLVAIGAGLLWFGWFGFNAGSALAANELATIAFTNTTLATSVAGISWIVTERLINGKPTVLGLASGIVSGLVAITPAAGFVNVGSGIIIGLLAGIIPPLFISYIKPALGYDDALDVFGIHGVSGIIGSILTGVFADPSINQAGKGLLYSNPQQLVTQLIAVGVVIVYTFIVTLIIMLVVKAIDGLRVSRDSEIIGLDRSEHGEKAYNLHV